MLPFQGGFLMISLRVVVAPAGTCLLLVLLLALGLALAGEGQVVRAGSGQMLRSPDGLATIELLLEPPGAGAAYLGRAVFLPGARAPEHRHPESEELIYVLSGQGTMTMRDTTLAVEKGMAVRIPAGVPHSFTVEGEEPMEVVQVYNPGGPEQRFRAWQGQPRGEKP
jgi:quercetin dioxygenase-like cupin family protein